MGSFRMLFCVFFSDEDVVGRFFFPPFVSFVSFWLLLFLDCCWKHTGTAGDSVRLPVQVAGNATLSLEWASFSTPRGDDKRPHEFIYHVAIWKIMFRPSCNCKASFVLQSFFCLALLNIFAEALIRLHQSWQAL